jgi:hypothetical protein
MFDGPAGENSSHAHLDPHRAHAEGPDGGAADRLLSRP